MAGKQPVNECGQCRKRRRREVDALRGAEKANRLANVMAMRMQPLRKALNEIACWPQGQEVGPSFDEPASAKRARQALKFAEAVHEPMELPLLRTENLRRRERKFLEVLALAQGVMEAYAKGHELQEWHARCEELLGVAYPARLMEAQEGGEPFWAEDEADG